MPLLIGEEDVRKVLRIEECIEVLEDAVCQEGLGTAVNRTMSGIYADTASGETCQYISYEGALSKPPVFVLRVRANTPGSGSGGANLLMLFSAETGEALAMLQQRIISCYRVGATAGLAAREMAKPDAKIVGIVGSGGQAHGHALAYAAIKKVKEFKVYSPSAERRTAFASWITRMTGVPARGLDSAEAAVRGSDIVAACTNVAAPIIKAEWLDQPGVHMTGVQVEEGLELELEGLRLFDRVVKYMSGTAAQYFTDPQKALAIPAEPTSQKVFRVIPKHHSLADVLLKRAPGRERADERNYFFCQGTGTQFAAVGHLIYQRAREMGVGQEMPAEWAKWFSRTRVEF
jgi:ornithine cyclodeaminase/alanine dehydrogenase-like protein (mu-crystallin family)